MRPNESVHNQVETADSLRACYHSYTMINPKGAICYVVPTSWQPAGNLLTYVRSDWADPTRTFQQVLSPRSQPHVCSRSSKVGNYK